MDKLAVGKFLGIKPRVPMGSIDPKPIDFKPNTLICADIMYVKDNSFEDIKTMCKVPNETYSNTRKIFICKDTLLEDTPGIKSRASKRDIFDESIYLAMESHPTFAKLISAGRSSFVIKTDLYPMLVVYTNPKSISVLKENDKSPKNNQVDIPQHLWRHTPANGYVFSMNLSDKKSSLDVVKMYLLKNGNFVEFGNDKELSAIRRDTMTGIIDRSELMEKIRITLNKNHFK